VTGTSPAEINKGEADETVELKDDVVMIDSGTPTSDEQSRPNDKGETGALHWKSGDVVPQPGLDPDLVGLQKQTSDNATEIQFVYVVAQYKWEPTPDQAAEVLAWGYREIEVIPENGFIVRLPVDKLTELAEQPFVQAVMPLRPEWKLEPNLSTSIKDNPGSTFTIRLVAFEPLDLPAGSSLVRIGDSLNYEGNLTADQITTYLNNSLVKWIEPAYQEKLSQ